MPWCWVKTREPFETFLTTWACYAAAHLLGHKASALLHSTVAGWKMPFWRHFYGYHVFQLEGFALIYSIGARCTADLFISQTISMNIIGCLDAHNGPYGQGWFGCLWTLAGMLQSSWDTLIREHHAKDSLLILNYYSSRRSLVSWLSAQVIGLE